jgi:hypothetical protein
VKQWTSDAKLRASDRPKYGGKIPQKTFGIREEKVTQKSATQYGWGFQRSAERPQFKNRKEKKAPKKIFLNFYLRAQNLDHHIITMSPQ